MFNQHVKQLIQGRIAARVVIATTITLTMLVGCEKSEPAATLVPPSPALTMSPAMTMSPALTMSPAMTMTATPNPIQTSIPPSPAMTMAPTMTMTDTPIPPSPTMTMTATLAPPSPTLTMTATTAPPVLFSLEKSAQSFPSVPTVQIGLGDLDGDGDLDAVFANGQSYFSTVWLNDGNGHFTDSGQQLTQQGHGVGVGDLDGDGDLDLFLTCHGTGSPGDDKPSRVYLNDGHGVFYDSGQDLGDTSLSGNAVNLADIDVDGDLDAIVAYYERDNWVYLNDGQANFDLSEMTFPTNSAWGDLDSDGDVDVFLQEDGVGYQARLNDGMGDFDAHWAYQDTTATIYGDIALGDVDNDGDLDAIVANGDRRSTAYPVLVLQNDGTGQFVDSGQRLGAVNNAGVSLGDLTGDGYPDLVFTDFERPNQIWLNDGAGQFIDSGFRFGADELYINANLADLDQDSDLDVFLATFGIDRGPNEIWFNTHSAAQTLPPLQSITVKNAERLQLLRTMEIPKYRKAQVSQCNVAFSPDSSLLVGACGNNRVPVWKVQGGQLLHSLYDTVQHIVACTFNPGGDAIACGGFDKSITSWDALTGEETGVLGFHASPIWELDFSPDGENVVSCGLGLAGSGAGTGDIRLWNLLDGQMAWSFSETRDCLSVSFSPSGESIAYGSLGGSVGILDAASGELLIKMTDSRSNIGDVAFSPSGRWLAAGSDDNYIYLWETSDYASGTRLQGHRHYVNGVAFNPGETLLASGSHDKTVGVWDLAEREPIVFLEGHTGRVLRVAFSPDGTLIASISWDGTVRLWGVIE